MDDKEEKTCDWVNRDAFSPYQEGELVIANTGCWDCGDVWGGWYDATSGDLNYGPNAYLIADAQPKSFPRYLSLNCQDTVQVQAIFQLTDGDGTLSDAGLDVGGAGEGFIPF